jgi:hypothetical protein
VGYRYVIRVDPPEKEGDSPRDPTSIRERLFDGLSHRLRPRLLDCWEAIEITNIPTRHSSATANEEMHRRLAEILDAIDPRWREYYVIVPLSNAWRR